MMRPLGMLALAASASAASLDVLPGVDELHRVLDNRRSQVQQGGSEVAEPLELRLQPGQHRLTRALEITPEHGPLRFVGTNGSVISGGVPVTGWTKDASSPGRWKAPIPDDFNSSGIGARMQMWRGDTRLTLARSPTLKYVHANATAITFKGNDIASTYHDFENVYLVLYESWTASMHMMSHVDESTHNAYLASTYNAQWANSASGSRYYVENALEHLDTEGEYYVDHLTGSIFLQSATDPSGDTFNLAGPTELLVLHGTSTQPLVGTQFSNVEFAHNSVEDAVTNGFSGQSGDFMTMAMIHISFAKGVVFDQCTFRATGGYAWWAEQGAYDCQLLRSTLTDLGSGAVRIGRGHAVAGTGECEGHLVADNIMTDGGHVCQEGCGVLAQNIGNTTITHNEIGHFRYTGVSTGWTWGYAPTVITSFNHIHHIGEGFLSDMGCVYTLGHQPGSKVLNNYCSDVQSYNYGGWAYYTDEGSRDELFQNNVGTRTKCAGHHQHYGTDNILTNNIYYHVNIGDVETPGRKEILMPGHCDASIRASTHGRDPATCHPDTQPKTGCCCYPGCDQGKCSSFKFERNIVYQPPTATGIFVGTTFAEGLDNFTFNDNLYWDGNASTTAPMFNSTGASVEGFTTWQAHGKDAGSLLADPQIEAGTFSVKKTSPAVTKLGFVPIDISKVGPRAGSVGVVVRASHCHLVQSYPHTKLISMTGSVTLPPRPVVSAYQTEKSSAAQGRETKPTGLARDAHVADLLLAGLVV